MSVPIYVYLAPRANVFVDGHFYWYLYRVISHFKRNANRAIVIVPESSKIDSLYELVRGSNIRIVTVGDSAKWGNDIGAIRPFRLSKLLSQALSESGYDTKNNYTLLFCNESSLASVLSMLILVLLNPNYATSINIIDVGLWKKLINDNYVLQLLWRLVIKRIFRNERILLTTNSPLLLKIMHRQGLSTAILWKYYQLMDASSNLQSAKLGSQIPESHLRADKILVLPWPDDSDSVTSAMKILLNNKDFKGSVQIHLKKNDVIDPYQKMITELGLDEECLYVTQGVLDEQAYISLLKSASLIWLPYSSQYHAESGSGRAIDALANGTPILIDRNSNLLSVLDSAVINFVFPVDCTNAILVAEICLKALNELRMKFINPQIEFNIKSQISNKIRTQFAAEAMINEITANLRPNVSNRRSNLKLFFQIPIIEIYFGIVFLLDITNKRVRKQTTYFRKRKVQI